MTRLCWILVVSSGMLLGQTAALQAQPPAPSSTLPRLSEYSRSISDLFLREASARTGSERAAAIRELTELYDRLQDDPRYAESDTLQGYKARIWSRLTKIKKEFEREISRLERQFRGTTDAKELSSYEYLETSRLVSANVEYVALTMGGPAKIFAHGREFAPADNAALGGAGRLDYGRQLVQLIQRTIAPDHWDVNGGTGTIFYYQPLHALVIRARADVHESIGGLLDDLR
jgi:hypothetical protein